MFKQPVMFLRDSIIFPNTKESTLLIGREDSIKAIDLALKSYKNEISIITQMYGEHETPNESELMPMGTVCKIIKSLNFSDGTRQILIEGISAFNVKKIVRENDVNLVEGDEFTNLKCSDLISDAVKEEMISLLQRYNPSWRSKIDNELKNFKNLDDFVQTISNFISSPYSSVQKQEELELINRDLNYWKQLGAEHFEDINSRILKRARLLTALPSSDKLNLIKEILESESI